MMRELLWEKKLTKTDAQRQTGNPTGDLRLTRARFKVNNTEIDQTKYFRYSVFGDQNWVMKKRGRIEKEICQVLFRILIEGEEIGQSELEIQHKPSGEANQSNYTTGIRWGPWLSHILINETDCTGLTLSLWKDNGYTIDIR